MGCNSLTYSGNGLALTEQFEGCRLKSYRDLRGIWTVGYGHTGPDVLAGMVITQDQATNLLAADINAAVACVNQAVLVTLSQEEFDALVDFVFNVGPHAFEGSTLLKDINSGDFTGAAEQFCLWDHASGGVVAGLLRRRQSEMTMFQETDLPAQTV